MSNPEWDNYKKIIGLGNTYDENSVCLNCGYNFEKHELVIDRISYVMDEKIPDQTEIVLKGRCPR